MEGEKAKELFTAMAAARAAMKPILKNAKNAEDGYSFARLNDYITATEDAMAAHGLFLAVTDSRIHDRFDTGHPREPKGTGVVIDGTLFHIPSGESLDVSAVGEGWDQGDKGTPKAITGARKALIASLFNLHAEDDPEQTSPGKRTLRQEPAISRKPGSKTTTEEEQRAIDEAFLADPPSKKGPPPLTEEDKKPTKATPVDDAADLKAMQAKKTPAALLKLLNDSWKGKRPLMGNEMLWARRIQDTYQIAKERDWAVAEGTDGAKLMDWILARQKEIAEFDKAFEKNPGNL